jgi:two-component system, NtrC family, sensor histidine kinase HydH
VVEDFLQLARPVQVEREVCDLGVELGEVVTLVSREAAARGVRLLLMQEELPSIRGDCDKLRQVFLNLILNGVQATSRGGRLTVTAAASPSGEGEPSFVAISFADTGEGMAPDVLARIFEPFYTTKEGGTGLGLAIAQKIVESHGGRIEVESVVGQGATFTVKLPL